MVQVAAFQRLADKNTVLGFAPNTHHTEFVTSPILKRLFCCKGRGQVSIAYVPPGRGKTIAAMTFLTAFKDKVRGIAICRVHGSMNFVDEMAERLGNPPDGWLGCLVDGLHKANMDKRKTFLILDEFTGLPGSPNDELLKAIKTHVRDSCIHVVVLSPSETYATHALSLNALQGIVPLRNTYTNEGNWVSMEWSQDLMRSAAKKRPALKEQTDESIDEEIDEFLGANPGASPVVLFEHLESFLDIQSLSPGNSFSIGNISVCEKGCIVS